MSNEYIREKKEEKPIIAICYDFDKTLSPTDMQAQGYIQSVGYDIGEFWHRSNTLASENEMDQNLSYMYVMKQESEGKVLFTKETLMEYGSKVQLFPGVEDWFNRICQYGDKKGVIVEHYIISSGLKEMIEGTSVAKEGALKKIYASSFYYNEKGVAIWPAQVVNYTNKTQFLFRIKKGVLDINDFAVNDHFSSDEERIPFENMIYIGDSDTDIPCMKLVNTNGGYSIGVYNAEMNDKTKVYKMMRDERIRFFVPADYSEGKEMDTLVKKIIDRTVENEALNRIYYDYKKECKREDEKINDEERKRIDLIIELESSRSFASTHTTIKKLRTINNWSAGDQDELYKIALNNNQVKYILNDYDVAAFYKRLLENTKTHNADAKKIQELLEDNN